jgi:hypothetical protein
MPYNTLIHRNIMTSKNQLQSKIQELEAELQEFKQQLNTYKEITIENASLGDVLDDGSIVLQKSNGLALLVAPKSTEVRATWSKEFPEVFEKLKEQGFNPSQFFIPTKEQLNLAYKTIPQHFAATSYWSSAEVSATNACSQNFFNGNIGSNSKTNSRLVRPFRCVTY